MHLLVSYREIGSLLLDTWLTWVGIKSYITVAWRGRGGRFKSNHIKSTKIMCWILRSFDSVRFNSIQFDSIQFDSIRFHSLTSFEDSISPRIMVLFFIALDYFHFHWRINICWVLTESSNEDSHSPNWMVLIQFAFILENNQTYMGLIAPYNGYRSCTVR